MFSRAFPRSRSCLSSSCFSRFSSLASTPSTAAGPTTGPAHRLNNVTESNQELKQKSSSHASSIPVSSSVNPSEITKFSLLSSLWWRHDGPFAQLHNMQGARVSFIRENLIRHRSSNSFFASEEALLRPFQGFSFVDIGCGGGILSESLARLGGAVTGVDASAENIGVAETHRKNSLASAPSLANLSYLHTTAERLVAEGRQFDVVCSLEVAEHVENPRQFLTTICNLVKPGGSLFVSTINRSALSYLTAIVLAERVLKMAPQGTHNWKQFLTMQEVRSFIEGATFVPAEKTTGSDHSSQAQSSSASPSSDSSSTSSPSLGMMVDCINGISYNPLKDSWYLDGGKFPINYIVAAKRPF